MRQRAGEVEAAVGSSDGAVFLVLAAVERWRVKRKRKSFVAVTRGDGGYS